MAAKKKTKSVEETKERGVATRVSEIEKKEAQDKYNKMMKRVQKDVWGHDDLGMIAIQANMSMMSTKTGIYSRIPIYCKGEKCPYGESCVTLQEGLAPVGQACPYEVAMLQRKIVQYTEEFGLDSDDASFTDRALVEEIILMEINMERVKALMSKETEQIQMMCAGMSEDGEPIMQPQVSKTVEAYERFSKKRNADYELLMATRKNKKDTKKDNEEDEHNIFDIIEKAQELPDFYTIEKRPEDSDIEDAADSEEKD